MARKTAPNVLKSVFILQSKVMEQTLEQPVLTRPSLCVFCGGSNEGPTTHRGIAAQLGTILAENGVRLVFGGGSEGLMGSISAACLQAGGTVHGIIPQFLKDKEQPADNLSRLEVVETLHIRTQRMAQESHAFCALPGGFGTIEEILEFSTWRSLGRQNHPFVLVNPDGFWSPLLRFLEQVHQLGYIRHPWQEVITEVHSVEEVLPALIREEAFGLHTDAVAQNL